MNQPAPENILAKKVQEFLQANKSGNTHVEAQLLSAQLTALSKDLGFLPAAFRLLSDPATPDAKDKQILLSSLVKDKFKYQFQTMAHQVEQHYQQLISLARILQHTSYATYTNISMALAYIYLYLLTQQQASLQTFLAPLVPQDPSHARLYNYYFKTLEYIAAEVDNNKFVIDDLQRQKAQQQLISQQVAVLLSLNSITATIFDIPQISKQNVINCFQAWIAVHYDASVLNSLPDHSLFQKVISSIQHQDFGESAGNCLRSVIFLLKSQEENKSIFQCLSNCTLQILHLIEQYNSTVEYDKAEEFVRIIADFARKSKKMFIAKYDRNIDSFLRKLIHYLKDDILNTYETLAEYFEDLLQEVVAVHKKDGTAVHPDLLLLLDPLYSALCHKCQLPFKIIGELNHIEESKAHHISHMADQIIKNREFTEILFETISDLQGKTNYLQFVFSKMQTLSPLDERSFFPYLQIYLFSLKDALRQYPTLDAPAVGLVQMYIELAGKEDPNKAHPLPICVRRSFLKSFRSLATCPHKDPQFMYRIMCITISCFEEPLLYLTAEKTFDKLCGQNKHIATNIFSEFGSVLEKYPERSFIVKGLVSLMCSNSDLTQKYLLQALNFLFGKFVNEPHKNKRKEYTHSLLYALKAFKDSPISKDNLPILQQFVRDNWDTVLKMLGQPQRVKDDEDSDVEKIVRIFKIIMRTIGFQFSEFLEALFSTVLTAFQKYPICSYVYLVEVAVTVYSSNPAYTDYLRRLYSDFCDIAHSHMSKIEDISRFSYLLDDYMGMNKRFFQYNASIVLSSGKLPHILELSMNVFMGCEVPRVAKAAYSFLQTVFMMYWPIQHLQYRNSKEDNTPFLPKPQDAQYYQALKQFLLQKLEQIVAKMLKYLSSASTEQTRDYILDALVSQIKGFMPQNPVLWANLLQQIPSEILVQQQKERMLEMLSSLKGMPFQQSRMAVRALDKMLVLMNRRMSNSNNRPNIMI